MPPFDDTGTEGSKAPDSSLSLRQEITRCEQPQSTARSTSLRHGAGDVYYPKESRLSLSPPHSVHSKFFLSFKLKTKNTQVHLEAGDAIAKVLINHDVPVS